MEEQPNLIAKNPFCNSDLNINSPYTPTKSENQPKQLNSNVNIINEEEMIYLEENNDIEEIIAGNDSFEISEESFLKEEMLGQKITEQNEYGWPETTGQNEKDHLEVLDKETTGQNELKDHTEMIDTERTGQNEIKDNTGIYTQPKLGKTAEHSKTKDIDNPSDSNVRIDENGDNNHHFQNSTPFFNPCSHDPRMNPYFFYPFNSNGNIQQNGGYPNLPQHYPQYMVYQQQPYAYPNPPTPSILSSYPNNMPYSPWLHHQQPEAIQSPEKNQSKSPKKLPDSLLSASLQEQLESTTTLVPNLMLMDRFVTSHINLLENFIRMNIEMTAVRENWVTKTTLQETKDYIIKNRPKTKTFEECLKEVIEEGR